MQTTIWGNVPKDSYWMRNKEKYVCTLSNGSIFWVGMFAVVHYTIQIHPC
jgi:hypothetical protein